MEYKFISVNGKQIREHVHVAYNIYQLEKKCERCESIEDIHIHHKDENKQNNNIENLEILCNSCHIKYHHKTNGSPMSGKKHTDETKKKISLAHKGKKPKPFTKQHKENISKNHARLKGCNNHFYGKKHSEKTKQKMRQAWKRRRKNN